MSLKIKETQVLYDAKGKKTHVILPIASYKRLRSLLEDLEDIKAAKEVEHEEDIPWEEVKKKFLKKKS